PRPTLFPYTTLFRSGTTPISESGRLAQPKSVSFLIRDFRTAADALLFWTPLSEWNQRDCEKRRLGPLRNLEDCRNGVCSGRFARSEEHTSELQSLRH